MKQKPFVDYYQVFQLAPTAEQETIELMFRYLAKRLHPDVADDGNVQEFTLLVEAYETLKDSKTRAAYDTRYQDENRRAEKLVEDATCLDTDSIQRHQLLSLLYAKRRKDMNNPGIGDTTLESLIGCSREVMNFHLWYFKEKGWIQREDTGPVSITASGVDKIEATVQQKAATVDRRLTAEKDRVELQPV